jgi:hypothetical protein
MNLSTLPPNSFSSQVQAFLLSSESASEATSLEDMLSAYIPQQRLSSL